MRKLLSFLALATVDAPAWAATQTVTLSVQSTTCAACPITVKKALSKVDGVSKIEVSLEKREAVVTFDDTKTRTRRSSSRQTPGGAFWAHGMPGSRSRRSEARSSGAPTTNGGPISMCLHNAKRDVFILDPVKSE